jgi:RecA-family ATPase
MRLKNHICIIVSACLALKGARNEIIRPVPISQLSTGSDVDWIWHGYLARGFTTLLVGFWKAGKSTLISHLARALCGHADLGGGLSPTRTLIITEENVLLWIRRREQLSLTDDLHLQVRPFLGGKPCNAMWKKAIDEIAAVVDQEKYGLVVFDTFASLNPVADENDAAAMNGVLAPLQKVTNAGAAVFLVHHSRKGDGAEAQASRGSSALPASVDIIRELRRFDPHASECRRRADG